MSAEIHEHKNEALAADAVLKPPISHHRPMQVAPLVVDLDGTLLKTDTLYEGIVVLISRQPRQAFDAFCTLLAHGRAAMKSRIASFDLVDVETLPVREHFLDWLRQQAEAGRQLHLVSAAHHSIVEKIAARIGIFASCAGSDNFTNLKGKSKAAYLSKTFPAGFSYSGDSAADIAVWQQAQGIVLVGASASVSRRAKALGKPVEAEFARNDLVDKF